MLALVAIISLTGALCFANLEALGYGNHYYTAVVKSMLASWHNFFYAATERKPMFLPGFHPIAAWWHGFDKITRIADAPNGTGLAVSRSLMQGSDSSFINAEERL